MKKQIGIILVLTFLSTSGWCKNFDDQVRQPVKESIRIRQKTQKSMDTWAEQKDRLEAQFASLSAEQQQLLDEQNRLRKEEIRLKHQIHELETRISDISVISQEMLPFLKEIFSLLTAQVNGDLPFLRAERHHRLEKLQQCLDDSQCPVGEKFRKMMEALFIEAEYGNTVEVYHERITIDQNEILANVFRLGRLSLFFESLDHKHTGFFDPAAQVWKILPPKYNNTISQAVEIASKQRTIDLLTLPLGRIVTQ